MKKTWIIGLLTLALLLAGAAFADQEDAPVLLVQLPEDAQMVENVAFDDGDFIQTYQLSGGAYVQLLRYMQSDVTIDGLVAGDWPGATNMQALDLKTVGGCAAQGVLITLRRKTTRRFAWRWCSFRRITVRWCIRRFIRRGWARIRLTTRCSTWSIQWMCSAARLPRT